MQNKKPNLKTQTVKETLDHINKTMYNKLKNQKAQKKQEEKHHKRIGDLVNKVFGMLADEKTTIAEMADVILNMNSRYLGNMIDKYNGMAGEINRLKGVGEVEKPDGDNEQGKPE